MNKPIRPWRIRVRIYECDSLGHVNNAIYLHYLQQATLEAWPEAGRWQLRRLSVEYAAQAFFGDSLLVHAWPLGLDVDQGLRCGYLIQRAEDNVAVLRAEATWVPSSAERHSHALAAAWPRVEPATGFALRPARSPANPIEGRVFHWQAIVRGYEVGRDGRVGPAEFLRWVEDARMAAASEVGWMPARLAAAGCVVVQTRHDSDFVGSLTAGDRVVIHSRVVEMRRVRGTWRHEICLEDQLVAVDHSTGAFLDLSGRPTPPPQAMVDGLLGR